MNALRDKILKAGDLKRVPVTIPDWGATVYVKTMTGSERDEFEARWLKAQGGRKAGNAESMRGFRAQVAVSTVVDKDGNQIFEAGDAEALGEKSAVALQRIFDVAAPLNGLTKSDVDELVGNSEPGPSASSTSASPGTSDAASAKSSTDATPANSQSGKPTSK